MNDATLETARPPQPTREPTQTGHGDSAPDVPVSVQRRVLAWALEELAALRLNPLDRDQAEARFAALNAKSRDIYVYEIANRSAQLLEKPTHIDESANNKRRALVYLAFFRSVCRYLPATPPFQLALAVGEKMEQRMDMPIFASQKQRGDATILLPDIDFLNHDFYSAAKYDDTRNYRSKLAEAVFLGSTSGGEELLRRFVICMDGNGATCASVVIALKSNSVLLKYKSDDLLYYFRHMQPWLHYVPVEKESDIDSILDMEQSSPAFFEGIAENGKQFAASYLSRGAVFAYTAELFKIYAQCFSSGSTAEIGARISPQLLPAPPMQKLPVSATLLAHVQCRGDVTADNDGWIGDADDKRVIEGFTFSLGMTYLDQQFFYRSLDADGLPLAETAAGKYCGTRGRVTPIHGFMITCTEETSDVPALVYEGIFKDGFASGPVMQGLPCRSPGGAPLVAMRIGLATG